MANVKELDKLIEAVEGGRDESEKWRPALGDYGWNGMMAFHGSLDAAKSLHEALLCGPADGWMWNIVNDSATLWPGPPDGDPRDYVETFSENNPARAWLIAVLKAYRAQQQE